MDEIEFRKIVAEAEAYFAKNALGKVEIISGMFRPLRGKFENQAEGYLYELSEKYGTSLPTIMTEAHRIISIAIRVGINCRGERGDISWAWIACSLLAEHKIKSELFHEIDTKAEVAHFLDCCVMLFLLFASTHTLGGRTSDAMSCLFEATEARRLSDILLADESKSKDILSQLGKAGAAARHRENYSLKQDVFEWCRENFSKHRSMDAAASAIIEIKLVPVVFRTVREWVGEWNKQRSTGRP